MSVVSESNKIFAQLFTVLNSYCILILENHTLLINQYRRGSRGFIVNGKIKTEVSINDLSSSVYMV